MNLYGELSRDEWERRRPVVKLVKRSPGVAANRLTEITRKLAEDEMPEWRRVELEAAAERLMSVLAEAVRCRCCGRSLTNALSKSLGIGPECRTKGAA